MKREELEELHYITPIENVASILSQGIVSHRLAGRIPHRSVAMEEIQDRRSKVEVPSGRKLHEYANLYFYARNPMLYKRQGQHTTLCVLRVMPLVLDLPGVVIADQNAASDYARFRPSPTGLAAIERDRVFCEYWTHPDDPIEEWRHKSAMCAEVLVPNRVAPDLVTGAYVSCRHAHEHLKAVAPNLEVIIRAHLFFLQG
jgi:hypothetical protein